MSERPGFMMYHDTFHALDGLDDASFRRVMNAACEYSESGEVMTALSAAEGVIFGIIRNKLDADWERYQRRVEAGRKGGVKSGEVRRSNAKQDEATRSKMNDCEATRSIAKQSEASFDDKCVGNPDENVKIEATRSIAKQSEANEAD